MVVVVLHMYNISPASSLLGEVFVFNIVTTVCNDIVAIQFLVV